MTLRISSMLVLALLTLNSWAGPDQLRDAACNGDLAEVIGELDYGTTISAEAVDCAANGKHLEVVERFLDRGWKVNDALDLEGCSLLHRATQASDVPLYELVLKYGPDLNAKCEMGTPLLLVVSAPVVEFSIVQSLVDRGASVSQQGHLGSAGAPIVTPLYAATRPGNEAIVRFLLDQGAEPNQLGDSWGDTPLFRAQNSIADAPLIRMLVDRGARWDITDKMGYLPFTRSMMLPDLAAFDLSLGVDLKAVDAGGENALFRAYCEDDALYLLDLGLTANLVGRRNRNLLHHFVTNCDDHMPKKREILERVLQSGADVSQPDDAGVTPTMAALGFEHGQSADTVCYFAGLGADMRFRDRQGREAIHHFAAGSADPKLWDQILNCLLSAGMDVNAQAHDGTTPLMEAALNPREDIESYHLMASLIGRGANPALKNSVGQTVCELVTDATILGLLQRDGACP